MSGKNKPTRGPDPATGAPTFDMIETLLAGFRHKSSCDHYEDPAYIEAAAAHAEREKELARDPELVKLARAMRTAETAAKVRAERLRKRAEAVRNRLLSEGLTPEVLQLAQELVTAANRSAT